LVLRRVRSVLEAGQVPGIRVRGPNSSAAETKSLGEQNDTLTSLSALNAMD
jgi:hypothetical protein